MWRIVVFGGNVGYRARFGRRKKHRPAATGAALAAITASVITGVPAASADSSETVFVQGIAESTVDSAIVQAVIDLANAMGIATVAEGVETSAQVAELRRLGCDVTQGYYFSPALRAREFDQVLARHFAPAVRPSAPAISLPPGAARPAQLDAHNHQGPGQHQPRREDEQVATGHGTAPEFLNARCRVLPSVNSPGTRSA